VEKILWLDETRKPAVPGKDRSGSHLTLFPIISAAGEKAKCVLIHGDPIHFGDPGILPIKCYHTKSGFMERTLFTKIMNEAFIQFVNATRFIHGLDGQPSTRLSVTRCKLLKKNNINRHFRSLYEKQRHCGCYATVYLLQKDRKRNQS